MTEKERRRFRNLSLAQNILICLMYLFMLFCFAALWAAVEGVFQRIDIQRQGEIDDVVGWGILLEGFGGALGGFAVVILGFLLLVFTVWQGLLWLIFWKANRRTRPFSRRKPWGIADQILKILAGIWGLRVAVEGLSELFLAESEADAADAAGAALTAGVSLFFLITAVYLLILLCRKREGPVQVNGKEAEGP